MKCFKSRICHCLLLYFHKAQSDTEWKFGRAKLIRNMKKTNLSPAPLNLVTTLFQYLKLCWKRKGEYDHLMILLYIISILYW